MIIGGYDADTHKAYKERLGRRKRNVKLKKSKRGDTPHPHSQIYPKKHSP